MSMRQVSCRNLRFSKARAAEAIKKQGAAAPCADGPRRVATIQGIPADPCKLASRPAGSLNHAVPVFGASD
jgi:hypothetical protein